MAVEALGEKYRCNISEAGGGTLVCCGEDMERIENTPPDVISLPDSGAQHIYASEIKNYKYS